MTESPTQSKSLLTPFNLVAGLILAVGAYVAFLRFSSGLAGIGAVGDSAQSQPWGMLISFNLMCGVPLSAGGFVMGTAVYIFGMKQYRLVVRPAVLVGMIGYFFAVVALLMDVGRPWRLPYPMVVQYGVTSVLFLVAWHVALYLSTQFVEFSPAVFEWLNWKRWRKVAVAVAVGAVIFGVILSTLHQSALGALFLITPTKVHPLWYSPFIGLFFFVSAIAAGICMVILESALAHRYFREKVEMTTEHLDQITIGLGKAASIALAVYFAIKVIGIAHGNTWHYLASPIGHWFLLELLGFSLLPCVLFAAGVRERRPRLIRWAAGLTVLGIILNRLNVSIITFNLNLPAEQRFQFHWKEVWLSLAVVMAAVLTYRWAVNRMPVHHKHPLYKTVH